MMLLRAGVSARKCNEVIVTTIHNRTDYGYQVVENIINNLTPLIVEMSKLPSRQSVDRFRREAGELARIHLAHEFLENYREGIIVKRSTSSGGDETRKKQRNFGTWPN